MSGLGDDDVHGDDYENDDDADDVIINYLLPLF